MRPDPRPGLELLPGAITTGLLRHGDRAVLFDCCDSVTPARLKALGIRTVDWIFCTQYRRPNTAGAALFLARGTALACPDAEAALFARPQDYWDNWRNRWHVYHAQPGQQVPVVPLPPARTVKDGDVFPWHGASIRVLDTPGATDGSVAYVVEGDGRRVCFCGDVLAGPGQLWDLYSLQRGAGQWDYHGFMGRLPQLRGSLAKLAACGASELMPSHGAVIRDPAAACRLTLERLEAVWRNYVYASSINYYDPAVTQVPAPGLPCMPQAEVRANPAFIRYAGATSIALVSQTGAAFLVDGGATEVVSNLRSWIANRTITGVEGLWITHYHDDHVDALGALHCAFGCSVHTDEHLAEILTHPSRYWLPCLSPNVVPAVHATHHGESWRWHEFVFTAYHFPGQTYYHSGLLVEGQGRRIFFCGDSFSPCGLDDYCAGNRNLLAPAHGLEFCLDLLAELQPDLIYNQHQAVPFHFSAETIACMKRTLAARRALLLELLPWPDPNFGLDEHWVRVYPYESDAAAGATAAIDVQFTNHAARPVTAEVGPVLPTAWGKGRALRPVQVTVPSGADGAARLFIKVPAAAAPGTHVVPVRVTWDGRYLGQFRHGLLRVF